MGALQTAGGVVLGVLLTAIVGWVVAHFAPGVFATVLRRPPLHVHVETDPALMYAGDPNWVGSGWVLKNGATPEALGDPPTGICRDWREWMWPKGAYDGDLTEIRVTLQGAATSTVLVDGVRVTVHERTAPTGTHILCPVGGADITPRSLTINLDWEPGVVTYGDPGGEPAKQFAFGLANGEVEVFHIRAEAGSDCCRWTAQLLLIVDGERQTIDLNDNGQPFRTSASQGLPTLAWNGGAWQPWAPT